MGAARGQHLRRGERLKQIVECVLIGLAAQRAAKQITVSLLLNLRVGSVHLKAEITGLAVHIERHLACPFPDVSGEGTKGSVA